MKWLPVLLIALASVATEVRAQSFFSIDGPYEVSENVNVTFT